MQSFSYLDLGERHQLERFTCKTFIRASEAFHFNGQIHWNEDISRLAGEIAESELITNFRAAFSVLPSLLFRFSLYA